MKALVDGRHRLSNRTLREPPGAAGTVRAAGASIPTPLTLGLFDVVSVQRPVGRRKDRPPSWASLDAGECYLALPKCQR